MKFNEWLALQENHTELKQQMRTFLINKNKGLVNVRSPKFNFDMEAAIYWFAADFHEGQFSDLYKIVSTSNYNPSMSAKDKGIEGEGEGEGETIKELYQDLVDQFGKNS